MMGTPGIYVGREGMAGGVAKAMAAASAVSEAYTGIVVSTGYELPATSCVCTANRAPQSADRVSALCTLHACSSFEKCAQ